PWPRFEQRLREDLTGLGFQHRIVLAPNPAAARALTNVHDGLAVMDSLALREHIQRLPIQRSGLDAQSVATLSRMGLKQLGQILRLPRDTLARRFPAEVLAHLDRLLGVLPAALGSYQPADEFLARIEFNFDVDSHQAPPLPIRRRRLDLRPFLPIGLLSAERDAQQLFEVTRSRLEQLQLPEPVLAVRLRASDLPSFTPKPVSLLEERPPPVQPWDQLRERLRARLGDEAIHG